MPAGVSTHLSPELLVPRLGEYLIEKNLITPQNLSRALEYQNKKANFGQPKLLGKILIELGMMDRETLDLVITEQILTLHNALKINNNQLQENLQQRTREIAQQATMAQFAVEVTREIFSDNNIEHIINRVTKSLVTRLNYKFTALYLLGSDQNKIAKISQYGDPTQAQPPGSDFINDIPFLAEAVSLNTANILNSSITKVGQSNINQPGEAQFRAAIPLLAGDQAIGVLDVFGSAGNAFSPVAINIIQLLANQAAVLIQAIKRFDEANQVLESIQKDLWGSKTINTINQSITSEIELTQLYKLVNQEINQVMGEVNILIALYDSSNQTISFPYAIEDQQILTLPIVPLGEGLTSIVIRSKETLLLADDVEQRALELGAKVVGKPARSWLGVPLKMGGDIVGAIILQDPEKDHRFGPQEQQLIESLASQVAIAIRNASILSHSQRQAEREKSLYQITSKIRSSFDMQSILNITVQELSRTLGAQRVRIAIGGLSQIDERTDQNLCGQEIS